MSTFRVNDRVVGNPGAVSTVVKEDLSGRVGTVTEVRSGGIYTVRWDDLNYGTSVHGDDISLFSPPTFKVGDTVRTVTETYGDAYVPVGSVGVIVEVLGGGWYNVRFDGAPWPTDNGREKNVPGGWAMSAKQLEPYVKPVVGVDAKHLVVSDSVSTSQFSVGSLWFDNNADPETLDRISAQYAAAAAHVRARKAAEVAEVAEPQEYGARVEVDDPRAGADPDSRVIATRVGFDPYYPWLILWEQSVSGETEYRWNAYVWEGLAKRNPVVLP